MDVMYEESRVESQQQRNNFTVNPRVAEIGAGYWGKNLVRNFATLNALEVVCDAREETRAAMSLDYRGVRVVETAEAAFKDPAIHACVIATPAETHYSLAMAALGAGKDVFVEKPLALRLSEAEALASTAAAK